MSASVSPIVFEQRPLVGGWRIKLGVLDIGAIEQTSGRVIWYVMLPPIGSIRYRRAASIEQAKGDARELVLQWLEAAELSSAVPENSAAGASPARGAQQSAVR